MSTEEAKPVTETPAAEPTPAATEAVEAPKPDETKPAEETPAATTEPAAEASAEGAKEEAKPVEPKDAGHLHYHAPGNFLKEYLPIPPKKVFFWFGEEPVESSQLKTYLQKGKEAATSTAAWASQTGKGLLFFNKHGEDKAAPTGALNLADAEEIKEAGTSEFTFKLHGHKHRFDAQTALDRDSWVAAVKKIADEAKAKKDEIVNSEGYKDALAKLKPALAAVTGPKVSEEAPKKSTEEETPAEGEETKKAAKSRSRSRGPLGFFKTKKEEAKEKAEGEDKKEETPAAESAAAAEATPSEPAPATEATDAAPPAEDKKEEATEEPKKENRRLSRLENFFKTKPKEIKKEEAPAETAEEPAKPEETPAVVEPTAEASTDAAATEEAPKEEDKKEETAPKDHRKSSFLTGLKGFTQKVRSPSSEHPPAEPAKTEETPAATAETTEAPATEAPATEEPTTNGETSKTEKRRSSFFNFGTINKKKADATPATEEPAKAESTEEAAKPAEETAAAEAPKKSTEEKPEASPKDHKESPFASIGRRVSKVIRGEKAKKETKATPAVEEAKEEAKPAEEAAEGTSAAATEPAKPEEPAASEPTAIGDVVPEAVTVGSAPQSTPTVSATA